MRIPSFAYLIIVLALASLSGFLYSRTAFKYGLDVRGGIRLTYQIDNSKLTKDQAANPAEIMRKTIGTLERRATGPLGAAEVTILQKGVDQIIVELPGATNIEEAKRVFGTTASISWYHARTITNPKTRKIYGVSETPKAIGETDAFVFFREATPDRLIEPGSPEYQAIIDSWGEPLVTGGDLTRATAINNRSGYAPNMEFGGDGARNLERWSRAQRFNQEQLAAVLDGMVVSIAPLKEGAILSGGAYIDMAEPALEVKKLVDLLNSGALPVTLKELQSEVVDPTIGAQALDQILRAGMIAICVTAVFVLGYYVFPGFIALLALALYGLLTLTVLKLLGATFSLAAIAGVILSVGMAVDANILIFERIKEELKAGKTLKSAIQLGFSRALSAIVDSNACTIITSLVLMSIGTGAVKGFASTLVIGVALSLFTAVTVTRWLLNFFVGIGVGADSKWYGLNRNWFGENAELNAVEKPKRIIENRNRFFLISGLSIVIPGIFFFMGGLKLNAEFLGGFEGTYTVQNETTVDMSRKLSAAGYTGGNVKLSQTASGKVAYITIPPQKEFEGKTTDQVREEIRGKLGLTPEQDKGFTAVGPAIQQESIGNAIRGVAFALLGIIIYLGFRFGIALGGFKIGLRFAFAAIGALVHDILVVVALAAMFGYLLGWEVSALFITAMLTVTGFSTHDTIVIFDRIRENLRKPLANDDLTTLINRSVTQSLARSINTSSTVIVTLFLLIFVGSATPDLKFFNTVMVCGIISGTYSSIFNASPILWVYDRWIAKRKGEGETLMGIARRELAHQHVTPVAVSDPVPGVAPEAGLQGQAYGQVRRRRASSDKGRVDID